MESSYERFLNECHVINNSNPFIPFLFYFGNHEMTVFIMLIEYIIGYVCSAVLCWVNINVLGNYKALFDRRSIPRNNSDRHSLLKNNLPTYNIQTL